MLTHVPLDSTLAETLDDMARAQGVSLEQIMENVVRQYLRHTRREKIKAEFESYQAMHSDLRAKYQHEHVAIYAGQLVDHDADPQALARRVRERFGQTPVLVVRVGDQPMTEYVVRRPKLENAS